MSTRRWVDRPAAALYRAASFPLAESGVVKLFARVSPSGKLRVELVGLATGVGVIETRPAAVCPTTVTLPVTASALAGIPGVFATWNERGRFAMNTPDRPTLVAGRVSRTRTGVMGTNEVPAVLSWEMWVAQNDAPAECSLPCHTALGTCGSWATPT